MPINTCNLGSRDCSDSSGEKRSDNDTVNCHNCMGSLTQKAGGDRPETGAMMFSKLEMLQTGGFESGISRLLICISLSCKFDSGIFRALGK